MLLIFERTTTVGVAAAPGQADDRSMRQSIRSLQQLMKLASRLAIRLRKSSLVFHDRVLLCRLLLYISITDASTKRTILRMRICSRNVTGADGSPNSLPSRSSRAPLPPAIGSAVLTRDVSEPTYLTPNLWR